MQEFRHCTAALLGLWLLLGPAAARVQQPGAGAPAGGDAAYVIFLGGREIGREQASLARTPSGWSITSSGTLHGPLDFVNKRFELTYAPDWQPVQLAVDALVRDEPMSLQISFSDGTATSEITHKGVKTPKTDKISPRTVVLPNNFYAAYEALAPRLAGAEAGAEIPVYVAPQTEIPLRVRDVTSSSYQTPKGPVATRQYGVTFQNPGGPLEAEITIDDRQRFAKLEIPAASLVVAREDLAGVAVRELTLRNPTDVDVTVPAAGFGLAGTLTMPQTKEGQEHPAIVLVPGSGAVDRDAVVAGIPLFTQLARQLAELGYIVLRYDKRGTGQSGGRVERVTLQDYAEDVVAAVKWLDKRREVDDRRISVVGHSEGAAVGMLAAAREKRIAGLVLVNGMGTTGRELVLEQQQHLLNAAKITGEERSDKVELQKQILQAAVAEEGWEELPAGVRDAVDTPWYRSLLTFDPAKVMPRIRQPILILHGALDKQVLPYHAERLAEMAKARKRSAAVDVREFPALNHLMVEAKMGDVAEYGKLAGRAISSEIAETIASWLTNVAR